MHSTELKYRPDIDGLRAVAVLTVLCFHLGIPQLPGGFIGVDVFFVISGYLLTGIIAKEIKGSRFSIAAFYERRARRILPALMGVLVATTVMALHYLLPGELIAYAKSLLGAAFSYSNFYFWSTADYFDAPAQLKPLLHTWSLAVEEQFYVVLPLLLLLLARKWPRGRNATILAIAAASFACSTWLAFKQPDSAFYLPTSRAWELLMGSVLALDIFPAIRQRWLRELAALAGIAMIGYGAAKLTEITPFPGLAALLPCGGALLLIAAGRYGSTVVGKLLSLKPVTFVGLISYSVYLWHWPLIVYTRMGFLPMLPRSHRAYSLAILILSLILGTLSWQFIEKPFRVGTLRGLSRGRLFGLAGGTIAACAAVALVFITMHGFTSRFPASAVKVAELNDTPQQSRKGSCFITSKDRFEQFRSDVCMQLDPAKKNYLLLGDSHSAALWYGLAKQMTASNILQASVAGCKPGIDHSEGENCGRMMKYIFDDFLPSHRIDGLFLTARWNGEKDFEHLQSTIDWCRQHNVPVVIFGPVVEYDAPLPKLLAYSIAFHDPGLVRRHTRREMFAMDKAMQQKAQGDWHVQYISLMNAQCPKGECISYADPSQDIAMMADDNHLSNAGSTLVIAELLADGQLPAQGSELAATKVKNQAGLQ